MRDPLIGAFRRYVFTYRTDFRDATPTSYLVGTMSEDRNNT